MSKDLPPGTMPADDGGRGCCGCRGCSCLGCCAVLLIAVTTVAVAGVYARVAANRYVHGQPAFSRSPAALSEGEKKRLLHTLRAADTAPDAALHVVRFSAREIEGIVGMVRAAGRLKGLTGLSLDAETDNLALRVCHAFTVPDKPLFGVFLGTGTRYVNLDYSGPCTFENGILRYRDVDGQTVTCDVERWLSVLGLATGKRPPPIPDGVTVEVKDGMIGAKIPRRVLDALANFLDSVPTSEPPAHGSAVDDGKPGFPAPDGY